MQPAIWKPPVTLTRTAKNTFTPEASVTRDISADLERQEVRLKELHIDPRVFE